MRFIPGGYSSGCETERESIPAPALFRIVVLPDTTAVFFAAALILELWSGINFVGLVLLVATVTSAVLSGLGLTD